MALNALTPHLPPFSVRVLVSWCVITSPVVVCVILRPTSGIGCLMLPTLSRQILPHTLNYILAS